MCSADPAVSAAGRNGSGPRSAGGTDGAGERDLDGFGGVLLDVLVIGAGQAGLGVAYHLTHDAAIAVAVLDAAPVGQSWLDRWDSLRLFTPRRFSALPGLRFPRGPGRYPSRVEMAAYLRAYAAHAALPVRTGVRVHRLFTQVSLFVALTSAGPVRARQVVVATGPFHRPLLPSAAAELEPAVTQLHSANYRRPADVPAGPVLVVGGGNSAAQLAVESPTTAGRSPSRARAHPGFCPRMSSGSACAGGSTSPGFSTPTATPPCRATSAAGAMRSSGPSCVSWSAGAASG